MSQQQKKPQTPKANNNETPKQSGGKQQAQKPQTPQQNQKPQTPKQQQPQQPKPQSKPQVVSPQIVEASSSAAGSSTTVAAPVQQTQQQSAIPKHFPAIVKAVISGDTLTLIHPEKSLEKTVTLASIKAPSLARKTGEGKTDEQPFAFAAREFLRKKCIGKKVEFQWTFRSSSGRDYGNVHLAENRENLAIALLREGLAEVIKKDGKAGETEEYKKLMHIQESAQDQKKGKWTDDKQVIEKNTRKVNERSNPENVFKNLKGKPVNVVVEHVINGSTMKVYIPQTNDLVTMHLTGIQAPGWTRGEDKKKNNKKEQQPAAEQAPAAESTEQAPAKSEKKPAVAKPFAIEALNFTESHLLNREVVVIFEGTANDALHGSIIRSGVTNFENVQGPVTFQEELLLRGLAHTVAYNVGTTKFLGRFRQAEGEAKSKKLRLWLYHEEKPSSLKEEDKQDIPVKVLEVLSGDTVRVLLPNNTEERVSLSNVRAPKLGFRENKSEEMAHEARESFRKRLSGKKVTMRVDYRKKLGGKKEEKENKEQQQPEETEKSQPKRAPEERRFVTLIADGKNVGADLIREGLAKAVGSGEERSAYFETFKSAEAEAKKHKRGQWGAKKTNAVHHLNDLTSKTIGQVQSFFKILKDKRTRGVVEKVYSGSRFKITLPKDYVVVNFALNGVIAPAMRGRDTRSGARPFAKESYLHGVDNVNLRDVEVEIEDMDKRGNIVGQLFINNDNYGCKILRDGLAKLSKSAGKLKASIELSKSEEEAKKANKGVWSVKEEVKEQRRERVQKLKFKSEQQVTNVRVTAVTDAYTFFFQTAANDLGKIDELISAVPEETPAELKVGSVVLSQYTEEDPQFYRAKVKQVNEDGSVQIQFLDFGNSETVQASSLRGATKELAEIKPQAREGYLAFVEPHETKFRSDAQNYFREITEGKDLKARYEYAENFENRKVRYYTLIDVADKTTINSALVKNGYLFVYKPEELLKEKPAVQETIAQLEEDQKHAKDNHFALWEEGDVYADEEEDDE